MIDNCKEMNIKEAIMLAKTYHREGMRIIKQAPTDMRDVQELLLDIQIWHLPVNWH